MIKIKSLKKLEDDEILEFSCSTISGNEKNNEFVEALFATAKRSEVRNIYLTDDKSNFNVGVKLIGGVSFYQDYGNHADALECYEYLKKELL